MTYKNLLSIAAIIMILTACIPSPVGVDGTATQDALNNSATQTAVPPILESPTPTGALPIETPSEVPSSFHLSACASPGAYYVSNADGGGGQELISPSLQAAIDPGKEYYHVGLSYTWIPSSDALVVFGNVVDCDFNSPTIGQSVAGPPMSILGLDGSERLVIPGTFFGLSMDRTGTLIAAAHYKDYQDLNPMIELYSAQTGQLVLPMGAGSNPQFQP